MFTCATANEILKILAFSQGTLQNTPLVLYFFMKSLIQSSAPRS